MKVYIAAPYEQRDQAVAIMRYLESQDFTITSRWLREQQAETAEAAAHDLLDIDEADVLLLVNHAAWSDRGTGGRHVETGYALALGKRIVVFGVISNIFHRLPEPSMTVVGNRIRDGVTPLKALVAALRGAR